MGRYFTGDLSGITAEPLTVFLHGAGQQGYREPHDSIGGFGAKGIYIVPVDIAHQYSNNPYTGTKQFYTGWWGYEKNSLAINGTEKRIIRYVNFVKNDSRFNIDSDRIYVRGGSMGGGGSFHIAYHYPHIFASAAPTVPWLSMQGWNSGLWVKEFGDESVGTPVNSNSGPNVWDWQNMLWVTENTSFLPPVMHAFNSNDSTINHSDYADLLPLLENKKIPYMAEWRTNNHGSFSLPDNADFTRFKRNEAYPAFGNAATSSPITSVAPSGGIYLDPATGKRNTDIDWSSSLHDLFSGTSDDIIDEKDQFKMTFKSLSTDTTSDVTIRNAQKFFVLPGARVNWTNINLSGELLGSGTLTSDSNGLVTVPAMDILSAGNTMTLTYSDGASSAHQRLVKRFYFPDINPLPVGTINHATKEITVSVPTNVNIGGLEIYVEHTGSSTSPASGALVDFSSPVPLVVTAPDGSSDTYTVTVVQYYP